ncbi:P-type conjugative transfer protein TrbJ [Phenylobacterium sp.]|uniref:P-type conjugative transfer protein TrbJ n=1 Tax=Phenylobacterium sp. TaxID=1871053 RepID=UPI0035B2BA06
MPLPHRAILAAACAATLLAAASPAGAIVVFDPSNYAQNVLTAARALQQVNNQITSLQNQAQSLINQARNLASLPFSSLKALEDQVQKTRALLQQAQRLAYDVQTIDQAFSTRYGAVDVSASDQTLVDNAHERWRDSVAGFEDALKVQAGVVGNLGGARDQISQLVGASQSASGALQAAQAGNQLLALQTQQLADLAALLAAQGRAQDLEAARRAAAEDQAREQLRRFLAPGQGYRAVTVSMFHD